jgi:hypothetical protein
MRAVGDGRHGPEGSQHMEEAVPQRLAADRQSFVAGRADPLLSGAGVRRTRQQRVRCRLRG